MNTRKPGLQRKARSSGKAGFTLVELLVVITVIMLLATLLIPTIQTIVSQVYVGRSAHMIRTLHDGVMLYKHRTGFFPGEIKDTKVPGGSGDPRVAMNTGLLTGSQVLAACLFDIDYDDLNTPVVENDIQGAKTYVPYKKNYLISYDISTTSAIKLKHNTISDGFPGEKAMPICYFLASNALIDKNKVSQFKYSHNKDYMTAQDGPVLNQASLESWVHDRAPSPKSVLNNEEFILIAPGLNRKFLIREVPNPANPETMIQEVDSHDLANDYGGLDT